VILRSLSTQNFRNLAAAEITFHPSVNLVVGRNGQGKTNLLEAIYFLATTKSFRTARLQNVVRFDQPNIYASGVLQREGVEKTLSVGIDVGPALSRSAPAGEPAPRSGEPAPRSGEPAPRSGEPAPRRKILMLNGERVALSPYVAAMTVFAYSAARLDVVRGTPEERRRFLDRGIASIDPAYLEAMTRYGRVLRQRNALLHGGQSAGLDAWDAELVAAGSALQRARAAYIAALAEVFAAIVDEHGYHVRGVRMAYLPSALDDLGRLRRHELRARVSLAGPQRDQLELTVDGRVAAEVLSGGEQKMIVLFLKFAKLELFRRRFDEPAIFLLDDVDAELDLEILESLLAKLPRKTQVFATSAKEPFLRSLQAAPHRRLLLENGQVTTRDES
jgi:DNA replication and repair protein RecF